MAPSTLGRGIPAPRWEYLRGGVCALDRMTGQIRWQEDTSLAWLGPYASPIVGPGSRVYAGTHRYGSLGISSITGMLVLNNGSAMAVLEGATGALLPWIGVNYYEVPYTGHGGTQTLPSATLNTPPAITGDGVLFVGSYNADAAVMNALDTVTQSKIWTWPAGQRLSPPAVAADGTVYFGDDQGVVRALRSGASSGLAADGWPKPMGDARNSGRALGSPLANPLALSLPDDQTLRLGDSLTAACVASDPARPAAHFTYTLLSAPSGVTLNPTNGTLTWTPAAEQVFTTNSVAVLATDDSQPPWRKSGPVHGHRPGRQPRSGVGRAGDGHGAAGEHALLLGARHRQRLSRATPDLPFGRRSAGWDDHRRRRAHRLDAWPSRRRPDERSPRPRSGSAGRHG